MFWGIVLGTIKKYFLHYHREKGRPTTFGKEADLTKGGIGRHIITLSIPTTLGMVMLNLYYIVDLFWVGRLGPDAIAAVTLIGMIFFFYFSIAQTFSAGTLAIVSHEFGRKEIGGAVNVLRHMFFISLLSGVVIASLNYVYSEQVTRLMGGRGDVIALGSAYLKPLSIGFAFQICR